MPNCDSRLPAHVLEGLALFNAGDFFEAHEALETAWRATQDPIRDLYRGILQAAVTYLHITRGNYPGALKVYRRSQKWLAGWPETCCGIRVGQLRRDLDAAIAQVRLLGADGLERFDRSLLKPVEYVLQT